MNGHQNASGLDRSDRTQPGDSVLSGSELSIGYDDELIIDRVDIALPKNTITAIIGPNGSGKSTLLNGLARQHAPDHGTVLINGTDAYTMEKKAFARTLGLLSQESTSPGSVTVEELVYHGRYPHRGFFDPVSEADSVAVDRAISMAGIDHLRDRPMGSLSGGQKQLAWIAMALSQETDVLLLDEPTTFLDLRHQLIVMDIVERLHEEATTTVGLVLHDIQQAIRYAEHIIVVKDGAIWSRGPPQEVITETLLEEVFGIKASVSLDRKRPRIDPISAVDLGYTDGQ